MKYLKTYEQIKNFFPGELIGLTDYMYFVSTHDEKWAIWGYTKDNLSYDLVRNKVTVVNVLDATDKKLSILGGWKSPEAAQEFIDLINAGSFSGIDSKSTKNEFHGVDSDKAVVVIDDLKNQLKIIKYVVGAVRDDNDNYL